MNISRKKITVQNDDTFKNNFSVLTYNILADCHVIPFRNERYHFVEDENLLKSEGLNSKRHLLTMKELKHFNADIALLQEVDEWYSPILASELQKSGYDYMFYQNAGVPEGLALCYKKDKFQCIDTFKFFIHDEIIKIGKKESVPDVAIDEMFKHTVSLIATLRHIKTNKVIICATTHAHCGGLTKPALQCLHACLVCRTIHQMRLDMAPTLEINASDISVIFGGDFNGEPDHMSIQLMKNGRLTDSQMKTLETLSSTVSEGKALPMQSSDICNVYKYFSKYLQNPLKFSSAFYDAKGIEPTFTSAGVSHVECLDYIFYTPDLKLASVIDIDSTIENIYFHGGPTKLFASDHLPLVAEFIY